MSIVSDISTNIELLVEKLEEYDAELEKAAPAFEMEGKKLEELCRLQPKGQAFYDRKLAELKTIEDLIENKLKVIESVHWKKYNEQYSRVLSTRDIVAYIAGEKDYNTMKEILLEVVNIKRQYEAVVEGFKQMGWTLKNIVALRVAALEMAEL